MFLDIPFYRSGGYTNYDPETFPKGTSYGVLSVMIP